MKHGAILVLVALFATGDALAESWLCVADQATGFKFLAGQWKQVSFTAEKNSFCVPSKILIGRIPL